MEFRSHEKLFHYINWMKMRIFLGWGGRCLQEEVRTGSEQSLLTVLIIALSLLML